MDYQLKVAQIQAVINALGELDIKSTYENMDKLLGCMQMLVKLRDEFKEVKLDANADTK